jgi:hypothetical protein
VEWTFDNLSDNLGRHANGVVLDPRTRAFAHHVEDDTEGPDIGLLAVVSSAKQYFGRCVRVRAADGSQKTVYRLNTAESKVADLRIPRGVEEDVVQLDVAMANVAVVEIFDAIGNLKEDAASRTFRQSTAVDDMRDQVATRTVLHDDADAIRHENNLVEPGNARVVDPLEDSKLLFKSPEHPVAFQELA